MTTAISVKNLSKQYKIGAAQGKFRYGMLRDVFVDSLTAPIRYARSLVRRSDNHQLADGKNYIWALNDVCFDLEEGRVLGIVGRNGAGKSTLLKILSRVTEPTRGTISVRGRVGSLLEVGTGFHPELTGRRNIYLNDAILGWPSRYCQRLADPPGRELVRLLGDRPQHRRHPSAAQPHERCGARRDQPQGSRHAFRP